MREVLQGDEWPAQSSEPSRREAEPPANFFRAVGTAFLSRFQALGYHQPHVHFLHDVLPGGVIRKAIRKLVDGISYRTEGNGLFAHI